MKQNQAMLERAVRKVRQRMFNLPEGKQPFATLAIERLKSRINYQNTQRDYHWMYAAE